MKLISRLTTAAAFLAIATCCGGSSSATSPSTTTADGGGLPGSWTGSLSRPGGLGPIAVTFEIGAQNPDFSNTGPMTLTFGGATVTATGRVTSSGNDKNGYMVTVSLQANRGEIAGFPNCSIVGGANGASVPFTAPYKSMSIAVRMSYRSCDGFITPPSPLTNSVDEDAQLTLTKR